MTNNNIVRKADGKVLPYGIIQTNKVMYQVLIGKRGGTPWHKANINIDNIPQATRDYIADNYNIWMLDGTDEDGRPQPSNSLYVVIPATPAIQDMPDYLTKQEVVPTIMAIIDKDRAKWDDEVIINSRNDALTRATLDLVASNNTTRE